MCLLIRLKLLSNRSMRSVNRGSQANLTEACETLRRAMGDTPVCGRVISV